MPKMKNDEIIPIIKQAIVGEKSLGFGGMWFMQQSTKKLKKRIAANQELRTLITLYFDKRYVTVLLNGLNDSYIWAVWKINEEKTPVTVHDQILYNTNYKPEWMGFYEHSKKEGCEILGHKPSGKIGFNGSDCFSVCQYCQVPIHTKNREWVQG